MLRQLFPNPTTALSMAAAHEPVDPMDVKLVHYFEEGDTPNLTNIQLVFILNNLNGFNEQRRRPSIRFGKVVEGQNVIHSLSQLTCGNRAGFSIYFEYRCKR